MVSGGTSITAPDDMVRMKDEDVPGLQADQVPEVRFYE